jgi:lipoprotein Spr
MQKPATYKIFSRLACVLFLATLVQSCTLFKKVTYTQRGKGNEVFFDQVQVTINPNNTASSNTIDPAIGMIEDSQGNTSGLFMDEFKSIEYISPTYFRYAILLDIEVEQLSNKKLVEYIHQWWSVPYRIGGSTMNGIDCSNFVRGLTNYTYGLNLPRTSREQAAYCKEIQREELKEGDLVFFNTGRGISHVGLYMANNKFVHASTSMGVVISSLDEPYWKRRYVKSGRLELSNRLE